MPTTDPALQAAQRGDSMRLKVSELNDRMDRAALGGGKQRAKAQRTKGKMTVRERVDALLDPGTERLEIAALAGDKMYEEHGGCPCGGVVVIIGTVSGAQCIVVANDATVKAGAWFPITGKRT